MKKLKLGRLNGRKCLCIKTPCLQLGVLEIYDTKTLVASRGFKCKDIFYPSNVQVSIFFHDRAVSCRIFLYVFRGGVLHSNTSLKIEDLSQHYFARRVDHILLTEFFLTTKLSKTTSMHLSKSCLKEQSCFAFAEFFSFFVSPH